MEHKTHTRVFIGLGSNLGERRARVTAALAWLARHPAIQHLRHTALIETAPWGYSDQPRFINAVAKIETLLSPQALLALLQSAERALGRKARKKHWGPREIDLDILIFGDEIVNETDLVIPHSRLTERPFVLEQILELDPEIIHPALRVPLRSFLEKARCPSS